MNGAIDKPGTFSKRHGTANGGAEPFDWEATGRTDPSGREIKLLRRDGKPRLGPAMLIGSGVLLLVLAVGMGYVSYKAQFTYIDAQKHDRTAATLEALGLDTAAVIFALVALALAMLGRAAITERGLNLACVAGSLVMNTLSADLGSPASIFVWSMPAMLYAAGSDRLIAAVRRQMLGKDEGSPLKAARGLLLWTLRLIFGPITTIKGFRAWVLTLPTGPAHESKILPTEQSREQVPTVLAERVPAEQAVKALPDARRALPAEQAREQVTAQVSELTTEFRTGTAARREQVRALLSAEDLTDGQVAARLGIGRSTAQRDRKALGL